MDENKTFESGSISITAENMFPIIKKWLYSEKDIFIRELISNCSDAISKMSHLVSVNEAQDDGIPYKITVRVDKENKTLSFTDNGIGMTGDEVRKYINQVAFSGAKDFFEKYKDSNGGNQIIGHFGLGFYSAFMVSEKVTIDTLSFQPGAEAVLWTSESGTEYSIESSDRSERGTTITLHLAEDSQEFTDKWTVRETIMKYFRFLPTEIYLEDASEELKADAKALNDYAPLWEKNPSDCTEDEYKEFYHRVFMDPNDPLFWVHLNIDYPFRLKGILYFPKLKNQYDTIEGQVKLYCSRVFVADNIKEVIPEYLLLLRGCIDCPDLPLNVSRSFLQNDGTVTKLSSHINRKVADRLVTLFKNERDLFNKYWDDINPFIKYGCLKDEKFYDRVKSVLVFKMLDGSYKTVDEYLAVPEVEGENKESEENEEKVRKTVYYVTDENIQAQYIQMFRENGIEAVLLEQVLDTAFISLLESKNPKVAFKRIDSDLSDLTEKSDDKVDSEKVEELFKGIIGEIKLSTAKLMKGGMPAVLTLTEESRRMKDMYSMYAGMENMADMFKEEYTLVINSAHPLYKKLAESDESTAKLLAEHIFDLARLAQKPLPADEMTAFISRSAEILDKL